MDADCDSSLLSNQALVSENQRFKLILEESGNLVLKDNYRTMWESISGFIPHAIGPYKLILAPTGNLIIRSSNDFIIWNSIPYISQKRASPFKMTVQDEGRIAVTDNNGIEVWESWPVRNMSFANTFFERLEYRYVPCHGKGLKSRNELNATVNTLLENEKLISKNGVWDLRIIKDTLAIYKLNVMQKKFSLGEPISSFLDGIENNKDIKQTGILDIGRLTLSELGEITVWSKTQDILYETKVKGRFNEKPFKMVLNVKDGSIQVLNKDNLNILETTIVWNEEDSGFWAMGCDFNGEDFEKVTSEGHMCSKKCQDKNECTHYTWIANNGGECYLKKANKRKIQRENAQWVKDAVCGFLKNPRAFYNIEWVEEDSGFWAMDCDFNGEDFEKVTSEGHMCSKKCQDKNECTHYTWIANNGGECYLKKANKRKIQRENAQWVKDAVCGFLKNPHPYYNHNIEWFEEGFGFWAMNCDFTGNDMFMLQSPGPLCSWKCRTANGCTHFSWNSRNGGECYLKKANYPIQKENAFRFDWNEVMCGFIKF